MATRVSRFLTVVFLGSTVLATGPASAAPRPAATEPAVDAEAVAAKLVECAAVREGEAVMISGGAKDFGLLEAIAVHVRRRGAFPLIEAGSERLIRRLWDDVPAKFDSQPPALGMKLAGVFDVYISVDFVEDPSLAAHVPAERRAARAKAGQPLSEELYKRGRRLINLGNQIYPAPALARQFGLTQQSLSEVFWAGINTDYAKLRETGESLRTALARARTVHVTHPNGTDLLVRIEGRPIQVSDGVISAEDMEAGGAANQVWLPAGEVYLAPVPGTASGRVVFDRHFFQGAEVLGLTLEFKEGRLDSMTAKSGLEPIKALYDAAGPGREMFSVLDFGINPDISAPAGSKMLTWMEAGTVTMGIGGNTWAGGENDAAYGLFGHLRGSSVTLDGRKIIENGKLKP